MDIVLQNNHGFTNFSIEHLLCLLFCIAFIVAILNFSKNKWTIFQNQKYITAICIIGALTQLFKVWYRWYSGIFDIHHDLPLHLCNLMTLFIPFVMWFKWRIAWGIIFFWIIAGCSQSLITTSLTESLPNYEAIRYWAVHTTIVLGALFGYYGYKWKPTIIDAIRSWAAMNVLALILYLINVQLGSNYMYMNGKPPGTTFYDLLGEWPNYIWKLEFVIVAFFSVILIPFYFPKLSKANTE